MNSDREQAPDPDDGTFPRGRAAFFQLSSALALTDAEIRALLSVSAETVAALKAGTVHCLQIDQPSLQRRLDYAIPLLQRMVVSAKT